MMYLYGFHGPRHVKEPGREGLPGRKPLSRIILFSAPAVSQTVDVKIPGPAIVYRARFADQAMTNR